MDNAFDVSERKFEVTSGRLLVADPYNLGYDEKKLDSLLYESKGIVDDNSPIKVLDRGILYGPQLKRCDGATDCSVYVFQHDIVDMDDSQFGGEKALSFVVEENLQDNLRGFLGEMSYAIEREIAAKAVLEAPVDLATLLIGDAEVYGVPEEKRVIKKNQKIPSEDREFYEQEQMKTYETTNNSVLEVPNGWYAWTFDDVDKILQLEILE